MILFFAYGFFDHEMIFLLGFFFLPRLVPGIVAFVVIGLIPLSAPASWTHCVSFCSPQEGRTGASVFGLAMLKSALLVPTQDGGTCLSLSLGLSEKNMALSLSAEGRLGNTDPFVRGCGSVMAVTLLQFSRAVSLNCKNISVYSGTSLHLSILLNVNMFYVSSSSVFEFKCQRKRF